MEQVLNKARLIDIAALVIVIGAVLLAFLALETPPAPTGKDLVLTLSVTRNADLIEKDARKLGTVYFNSIEYPVKTISVEKTTRNNQPAINIQIESKGEINENKIIFDGARVLIGQKAEIHGNYFAQGVISDVRYK